MGIYTWQRAYFSSGRAYARVTKARNEHRQNGADYSSVTYWLRIWEALLDRDKARRAKN